MFIELVAGEQMMKRFVAVKILRDLAFVFHR